MSKFDWCYKRICNKKCINYQKDHCDGCNYFEAYALGMMECMPTGKLKIDNGKFICQRCNSEVGNVTKKVDSIEAFMKLHKYCDQCAARYET